MLLRLLHFRYRPLIPVPCAVFFVFSFRTLHNAQHYIAKPGTLISRCTLYFRLLRAGHVGSPVFPSYPCKYMPCSQTPVVPQTLACYVFEAAAFRPLEAVSFHIFQWLSKCPQLYNISGLSRQPILSFHPCSLAPHTLGNTNQFPNSTSILPKTSDLSRHDQ